MEALKWLAIAALSLAGAYFGHRLTGDWTGSAAAGVGVALILSMLVNGQWTIAAVASLVGGYLVFTALGEGPRRADKAAVQAQAVPAGVVQDAKRALLGLLSKPEPVHRRRVRTHHYLPPSPLRAVMVETPSRTARIAPNW